MDRLHTKGLEWGPDINIARYTGGGRSVSSGRAWVLSGGCWAQAQCTFECSSWVSGKHSIQPLQGPKVTHAVHRFRSKRPMVWGAEEQGPQSAPRRTPPRVAAPPLRPNSAWLGQRNGVGTPFFLTTQRLARATKSLKTIDMAHGPAFHTKNGTVLARTCPLIARTYTPTGGCQRTRRLIVARTRLGHTQSLLCIPHGLVAVPLSCVRPPTCLQHFAVGPLWSALTPVPLGGRRHGP